MGMRRGRVAAASLMLGLCTALLALADGFHGAMNAEELSDQWNQNKYAAFSRGGDFNGNLGGNVQNLLNHMKYLNQINVQPSEFPNFKDKDIPGVKSQAMAILKEMGKGAGPVILNSLIQELKKQAQDEMGMTANQDYVFNLKMLLEDLGRDVVQDLKAAIARSNGSTRDELQRILDRILKKEKDLQKDLDLKSDVELSAEIQGSVQKGLRVLLSEQSTNGSWTQHAGYTALALLAMLKAGMDPSRDECQRAAAFISAAELNRTYDVALTALALDEMDRRKYRPIIESCVRFLHEKQLNNGMWDYRDAAGIAISQKGGQTGADGDHSNSQFALLGLIAAQKSGIPIGATVLDRARRHWSAGQNTDGGWGYGSSRGQAASYGSMTAAGVASLFLLGNDLFSQTEKCGIYVENDSVARGLDWLGRSWSVSLNPGAKGGLAEPYYYLYAVERIGVLTGLKYIGSHDWYREGAAFLVKDQRPDGSWGRRLYGLSDTCFSILFLAKWPAPILLSKLRWEGKGLIHRLDARHWAEAAEPILRQRLSYQILDKKAPASEFLKAPLLFINGHSAPTFTPQERETVRTFIRQGGVLVAEACCSSAEFDRGFRAEMAEIFPEKRIVPLPTSHPVYTIRHQIRDSKELFLQGFTGCRTSVFYSPRGFTCPVDLGNDPNEIGFRLAVNLALYATGNQRLSDERQVEVRIAAETARPADAVQRGAFLLAQIKHDGDWNPDANVVPNILQHLKDSTKLRVSFARDAVTFSHAGLFDYSALFVTGHAAFAWTKEDAENLRSYLRKGGFLLAESCCGNTAFDRSFREFMKAVFPESKLSVLPLDHRVYTFGRDPRQIQYREIVRKENPDLTGPSLEGITTEGNTVVFYSKFSLGCSIEDHPCVECRGYTRNGAIDLVTRVFLAGLTE
ncbi:MAG: DUF4159 domain-containing protein [Planctomycetes bacterium]|nr:DUF4159 domain-containing protein [Planctomycetota bacterium]